MKIRGVAKRGTLEFNGLRFSTTPAMYELSADEAAMLQTLHGDRLVLELLEPEPTPTVAMTVMDEASEEPAQESEPGRPQRPRRSVAEEEAEPVERGQEQ